MRKLALIVLIISSFCYASSLDSLFYHDGFEEAMKVIEQNQNIPFEKRSVSMNKIIYEYALLSDSCFCKYTPANGLDNDTLFHKLFKEPEQYADVIGKKYLFYSRYTEAIYYFTNYMISTKRTPELLLLRGFAHYNANHYYEAEQDFYTAKLYEESESSNEHILSIANASMALAKLTQVKNEYPNQLALTNIYVYKNVKMIVDKTDLTIFGYWFNIWEKVMLLECNANIGYEDLSFDQIKEIEADISFHNEVTSNNENNSPEREILSIILPKPSEIDKNIYNEAPLLMTYSILFLTGNITWEDNPIEYLFSVPIQPYHKFLKAELYYSKSSNYEYDYYDRKAQELLDEIYNSNIGNITENQSISNRGSILALLLSFEKHNF